MVAHDHGSHEGGAVLEADLDRTDVRDDSGRAVGQGQLLVRDLFQAQPIADTLRNAEVHGAGVGERLNLDRQSRDARIAQEDRGHDEPHTYCIRTTH
jgi:hypothetical protein